MSLAGTSVLVIEPDIAALDRLVPALEAAGARVHGTGSPRAAIRSLMKLSPDIVVTAVFMEDIDGIEVIDTVRTVSPSTRVIAMDGDRPGGPDYLRVAQRLGAAQALKKPVDLQELVDACVRVCQEAAGA